MKNSLEFTFIANACGIFTGSRGTRILCDPWLVDGVFDGSWCHYPKLATSQNSLQNIDALYISHLHPDHFDERYFSYDKSIPIIVLDHGPNFLIKKLNSLGYHNLVKVTDAQSVTYNEFTITMYAPFAKHNFHESVVGNLIDSAMLISCDGVSALNANDNTLTIEAAKALRTKHGEISLAMLNYNAAGPYPSCFNNLSDSEKFTEHDKVLQRNFQHIKNILQHLKPRFFLPFAGAYVLGGKESYKNKFLGTATWDHCAEWFKNHDISPTQVVSLQENDTLNIATGIADKPYVPIDTKHMQHYIETTLSQVRYPYENDPQPNTATLLADLELASKRMCARMDKYGIRSEFNVTLQVLDNLYKIYPVYEPISPNDADLPKRLECSLDPRLLRRILDKSSHWNNAEIGAHINFYRSPNTYEPDLHTGLQFLHL